MKENAFCKLIIVSFCILLLAGCGGNASLTSKNVKVNTILIKKNGKVQSSIVEKFDKDYYNEKELKKYIIGELKEYNAQNGENTVVLDNQWVEEKIAHVIFTYANIAQYSKFNGIEADKITVAEAEEKNLLPNTFTSAKDASSVKKETVLKKNKYKVLIFNEKYDVMVEGTIKYFSGAQLINNKTVQTKDGETSVIIYK